MTPTILVVDDDMFVRQVTCSILERLPEAPETLTAENGADAVAAARSHSPDIVVMDWEMPVMSELDAIRAMAEDEELRQIPVVMLTGIRKESGSAQDALDAGAVDFVRKPVDPVELTARVRSALRIRRAAQLLREQNAALAEINTELRTALDEVETLTGLLPICCHCKVVRDDEGYWGDLESYLRKRVNTQFSHGICPDCLKEHYDIA